MDERQVFVSAMATRLRMVLADFADESPAVRNEYLAEEIERALERVGPASRQAFLEELMARFPTWEGGPAKGLASPPARREGLDERLLEDAAFLAERLAAVLPRASEADREAVARLLREAGLDPSDEMGWPRAEADALRARFLGGEAEPIDPAGVLRLLTLMLEFVCALDGLVWPTWRAMTAQTGTRSSHPPPSASLKSGVMRFLRQDERMPFGRLAEDLERMREVIAALISAPGRGSHQFACQYVNRFAPEAIRALVDAEGKKNFLTSREFRCWQKYVQLAGDHTEAKVANEVMGAIAGCAVSLLDGLNR